MHQKRIVSAALLAVFALAAALSAHASQVAPESEQELAAAPRIVVAEVESAQSRWNPQGTLILTDYRLRRLETLRGDFAARFVLTQGGGTVGEETHHLSDLPELEVGRRYLLFLNEADNPVFSSVRYGAAGARRVEPAGDLHGGGDLRGFRDLVARTAVRSDAQLRPAAHGRRYPASEYRREAVRGLQAIQRPALAATAVPPDTAAGAPGTPLPQPGAAPVELSSVELPNYLVQRAPAPTITFNPLPLTWSWSPSDQNMMSEWNRYGDIFRVLQTPTGTWAWNNNRYDLAGFPSDADMVSQFGAGWGATTLAICYSRWIGTGPIVESDVALNPAYSWTLDDAEGTTDAAPAWSFRQTLLHELGHSWGLQHPWETQNVFWPSTMNYGPKWARDPSLHGDDTAGIRSVYPGISQHDGSLSMYSTYDNGASNNANYVATVTTAASYTHGQSLSFVGPVLLQNLGTSNLVNPGVDVYLTAARMTYVDSIYLGRSNYTTTVAPFPNSLAQLNLGSYLINSSAPTGIYYPAIYLAASGATDAQPGNNSAWGRAENPVTVRNATQLLIPLPTPQLSSIGRIGPDGEWTYSVNAQAGYTYRFATCGQAAFDTVVAVQGSFPAVTSDDACGVQSELLWTSASNQTVTIVVSGHDAADRGAFQLEYSGTSSELIFRNGFQQP